MRQTASNRRSRSRQGGKRSGGNTRSGGNRKESRGRGNPSQQVDRYKAMAREALQSGDRILAENYLQHADHFQRLLNDRQGRGTDAAASTQIDGVTHAAKAPQRNVSDSDVAEPPVEPKSESQQAAKEPPPARRDSAAKSRGTPPPKREPKAEPRKAASGAASDTNGATPPKAPTKGEKTANSADVGEPSLQGVAFLNPTEVRPETKKRSKPSPAAAESPSPKPRAKRASKPESPASDQADEAAS